MRGEYNFQSQYQQSPLSREGGLIKKDWLKFYEPGKVPRDFEWTIQSWDTACKIGDANDYSVCTTWKLIGRNYYLVDVFRERLTYPELKRRAVELFRKFRPFKVMIEDRASGTALIQEIVSEGVYCAEAFNPAPGSDKQARFAAHSIKFENGRVFLPDQAPWLDDYIREITGFPGSKHDDQVDSTSQALESLEPYAHSVAVFNGLESLSNRHYPTEYGGTNWPSLFRY